jgi:hypothetical protein
MAVRREESLSDLLPELNSTMRELSDSKAAARREAKAAAKERLLAERRRKARESGNTWMAKHPGGWVKPGQMGAAVGGGAGFEFGPYIRPDVLMLSPLEAMRAMMPERVYAKGLKWENSSHESFPFNPRVNVEELCPPLPEKYNYLREKLTKSTPKPPEPPHPHFPKWVDAGTCPMYFQKAEPMAASVLTPAQEAAMVAPTRNFDQSVSQITQVPVRSSWRDFVSADTLRLTRDDQGRTGTVVD